MRKLAIALALSTTVLAGPALARDGAWYVGGDFGAIIVEDTDFTFTPGSVATNTADIEVGYDYGFDGAGFVGYDLGAFRIEAEVAYKKANIEEIRTNIGLPGQAGPGTARSTFGAAGGGDVNVLSFMVNGTLDFGDEDGLSGFVGGGAGIARVEFNNLRAFSNRGAFLDDSDTRFAWQVVAGVRQALSRNVDLTLRYRFFNVDDLEMAGFGGRGVDADLRSHSLLGGITFNFGGAAPPPPCEAPNFLNEAGVCTAPELPRTCPPNTRLNPATDQCEAIVVEQRYTDCPGGTRVLEGQQCPRVEVGPFIVYFGWDEDDLTDQARNTLNEVVAASRAGGQSQIVLAGHADRSGSAGYNVGLSQRRANAVRDYLAANGIGAGSVTTQAFGESRPAVETADGVREPQNRRVEITFGPGSGW
jgi:outer membrane protein OmpA-like peptidoglycan-associated protein/opacity protein-like surface antigen